MRQTDHRWHTKPELWEKLKQIAREKRHKPTAEENILWQRLRRNQLQGYHFRRQHGIGPFIVDFYCESANLVIEVDGPVHDYQIEKDKIRQQYLEELKFKIMRFTNDSVLKDLESVVYQIVSVLIKTDLRPLSAGGERDGKRGRGSKHS